MTELGRRRFLACAAAATAGILGRMAPAAEPPPELVLLDARTLSESIRTGRVSCVEVMTAYLDHIERVNPVVNAIVSLQPRDDLLRQARQRDAWIAQDEYLGWMHGLPQAVKDLAPTAGIRTTFGSPLFADFVPDADALIVERVRGRGAIIIGKTNVPEFGLGSQSYNEVFGTTLNAYDPSRCAGGSSGGAAAALALRMLPVADGSDMMGSLRNPAAFNNVIGFRPSQGRVPAAPSLELFVQQLSTEGPMGRTVADVALLLSVQAGHDPRAPLSLDDDPSAFARPLDRDLKGARVAWLGDLDGYLSMEPGILDLCRGNGLKALETIGCTVEEAPLGFPPDEMWASWLTWRHWLVGGGLAVLADDPAKRARMKPEALWEIEGGRGLSAFDVYRASQARSALYGAALRLFETHDYLALPTAQVFPFPAGTHWPAEIAGRTMDTYHRWMEVVILATLTGCPAINLPVGFNAAGLPMGMQVLGRPRADLAVLQLGHAYEQAAGWVNTHLPPVL